MGRRNAPPSSISTEPTVGAVISKKEKKSIAAFDRSSKGKRIFLASILIIASAIMAVAVYFIGKNDSRMVDICSYNKAMTAGEIIAEENITSHRILKSEYDGMCGVNLTMHNGEIVQGDRYILYKNKASLVGKTVVYSSSVGDIITNENTTDDEIQVNPWYSAIEEGQEIYTLPFDSSDVYVKYLVPGSSIRMRVISTVPLSADATARQEVKRNETSSKLTANSFRPAIIPTKTFIGKEDDLKESAISETVFEGIRLMDALNADGESIFDIYYTLSCMDSLAAEKYIQTNAASLKQRIVPASLILVVDKDEASRLAEYEQTKKTAYKYTIVKDTVEDDLYRKFNEIGMRITKLNLQEGTK